MKELIIATKNEGKAEEFKALFQQYGVSVLSLLDLGDSIPDVEETGTTFQENAYLKASEMASYLQKPVIADDSGLVVDALDGAPGIYSARYAGEPKSDERNNDKLLDALKEVHVHERDARFICMLAFCSPNQEAVFAEGRCEGSIAVEAVGANGFGYDPIFIPRGYESTMAELSSSEKNKLSHRHHALQKLEKTLLESGMLGENDA